MMRRSPKGKDKNAKQPKQAKQQESHDSAEKVFILEFIGTNMKPSTAAPAPTASSSTSTSPRKGLGRFLRGAENAVPCSNPFYQVSDSEGAVLARSKVMKDGRDPQWPAVKISWQSLVAPILRQRQNQGGYDSYSESEQDDEEIHELVLDRSLHIQVYDCEEESTSTSTHQLLGQFSTTLFECMQKARSVQTTLKNTKINTLKKRQNPNCCFDLINYEKKTLESYGHLHVKTAKLAAGKPDIVDDHLQQGGMMQSFTSKWKKQAESSPPRDTEPEEYKNVLVPEEKRPSVAGSPRELNFNLSTHQHEPEIDPDKEAWRVAKEMQKTRLEEAKRSVREAQAARLASATAAGMEKTPPRKQEQAQRRKAQEQEESTSRKRQEEEKQQEEEIRAKREHTPNTLEKVRNEAEAKRAAKVQELDESKAKRETDAKRAAKVQELRRAAAERREKKIQERKAEEAKQKQSQAEQEGTTVQQTMKQEKLSETQDQCREARDLLNKADLYKKLTEIPLPDNKDIQDIFEEVDRNGDGSLSLKEVEKAIIQRKNQFNLAPTIVMRAFHKADTNHDGAINRNEFFQFVRCINYFQNLLAIFEEIDKDGNRRLSREEFVQTAHILNVDASRSQKVFDEMDENRGGYVVFDEFCLWMAEKHALDDVVAQVNENKSADEQKPTSRSLNFDAIVGAAVIVDHSQEEDVKMVVEKAAGTKANREKMEKERLSSENPGAEVGAKRIEEERFTVEKAEVESETKRTEEERVAAEIFAAEAEATRVEQERRVAERVVVEAEALRLEKEELLEQVKAETLRLEEERLAAEVKRLEEEQLLGEEAKRAEPEAKRLANEAYLAAEEAERVRQTEVEEPASHLAESDEDQLRQWDEEADAEEMVTHGIQDQLDLDDLDALLADDMDMDVLQGSTPIPVPVSSRPPAKKSIPAPRMTSRRSARHSAPTGTVRSPSAKSVSKPTRRSVSPSAKSASSSVRTPSSCKVASPTTMTPRELAAKEKAEQRLLNARRGVSLSPPCPHERRSVSPSDSVSVLIDRPERSEDADVFTRLYRNDVPAYMVKRVNPRYYDSTS